MADYKKMYFTLFSAMTEAIEILQAAQIETEGIYIGGNAAPAETD